VRKESVNNLVGCAIAADGNELAAPSRVSVAGNLGGMAWAAGFGDFDGNASSAQAVERRSN
jgi:hypothetical protein